MRVWALRALRSQNLSGLLVAAYIGLFTAALQLRGSPMARASLAAAVVVGIVAWAGALRRARAVAHLATSRIASAAQGYVEVMGRASVDPDNLILSPMSGVQCLWYRYRVFSRDNAKEEWRQTDSGVSSATFEIRDETGAARVDPDHAEVLGAEVRTNYPDTDTKLVEELLFGGRVLYVLGEFSTIGGAHSVLSVRDDVSILLAEWKADAAGLKRRFDLDGNGEIDLREWELARRLATKTVEQQHRAIRKEPGVHMLRAPPDGRLFLISALSPQTLRRRFVLWSFAHLGLALAAAVLLVRWR
ncbi:MAG TPA: hypothetical protein PLN82_00720 [Rhodoferax sp.]|nr:hypothetical protein [Rhodoferax sp.]